MVVALGNVRTRVRLTRIFNARALNYSDSGQVCVVNWVLSRGPERACRTGSLSNRYLTCERAGQGPVAVASCNLFDTILVENEGCSTLIHNGNPLRTA